MAAHSLSSFTCTHIPCPASFAAKHSLSSATPLSSLTPLPLHHSTTTIPTRLAPHQAPPRVASPFPLSPPIDADYLDGEFGGRGVEFESIGDDCVAKLSLENGSSAALVLPYGLVSSYRAPMWHGGKVELLRTTVAPADGEEVVGEAAIRGGVSVDVVVGHDGEEEEGSGGGSWWWNARDWSVRDVRGSSRDSVQVELISCEPEGSVEVKYVLTLREDTLSAQIEVSNSRSTPILLRGSILSHLNVSTPEATYAVGLEGSDSFQRPPLSSDFRIIPPANDQESKIGFAELWQWVGWKKFVPGNARAADIENDESLGGEESDNYKHLTEEMSLIYTSAPRNFTIIDRGRRNSVVIGREGYNELYLFSPGARHEQYSQYAFICVGQSALLKPVKIGPRGVWRGGQHLHNPNL